MIVTEVLCLGFFDGGSFENDVVEYNAILLKLLN